MHCEEHGATIVLRIEHGKANAIDVDFFDELDRHLRELTRADAQAVVLTGRGSIFSAGVNLFRVVEEGAPYLETFLPRLSASLSRLFTLPLPVVAAINGHAIAGGCVLAAACDHRVMARGPGRIGIPELRVGVPFPVVPLEVMRFLLPAGTLQDLVYSGRTLEPEGALAAGLVDELAEPEELLPRACEAATRLAELPREGFAANKRLLRRPAAERMRTYRDDADPEIEALWAQPETLDRIRAYLEQTVGKR